MADEEFNKYLGKKLDELKNSGLKWAPQIAKIVLEDTEFAGDSKEQLDAEWNAAVADVIDRNLEHLTEEQATEYYAKYPQQNLQKLDWEKMVTAGDITPGKGLTKADKLKLALKNKTSLPEFERQLSNARQEWVAGRQGKMQDEITSARMKELSTEWDSNNGTWDNIKNKVVEYGLPRSIETARNTVSKGEAPEVSPYALGADFVEVVGTSVIPSLPAIKLGVTGGNLARTGNIAANIGVNAAKDAAISAGSEGIASIDKNYDFNGKNILATAAASATLPSLVAAINPILQQYTLGRVVAEGLEKASKEVDNLPALERMKFDRDVKALVNGYNELQKMKGATATTFAKELEDQVNAFAQRYPQYFTEDKDFAKQMGKELAQRYPKFFKNGDAGYELFAGTQEVLPNTRREEFKKIGEDWLNAKRDLAKDAEEFRHRDNVSKIEDKYVDDLSELANEPAFYRNQKLLDELDDNQIRKQIDLMEEDMRYNQSIEDIYRNPDKLSTKWYPNANQFADYLTKRYELMGEASKRGDYTPNVSMNELSLLTTNTPKIDRSRFKHAVQDIAKASTLAGKFVAGTVRSQDELMDKNKEARWKSGYATLEDQASDEYKKWKLQQLVKNMD